MVNSPDNAFAASAGSSDGSTGGGSAKDYEALARASGTLRPFRLLVSMDAELRLEVASELGIKLNRRGYDKTRALDEDPHGELPLEARRGEAWKIIDRRRLGMRARCNGAAASIFKGRKETTWLDVCRKVVNRHDKLGGGKTFARALGAAAAVRASNENDRTMQSVEAILLARFNKIVTARLSPEEGACVGRLLEGGVVEKLRANFRAANVDTRHIPLLVRLVLYARERDGGVDVEDFTDDDLERELLLGSSAKEAAVAEKERTVRVAKRTAGFGAALLVGAAVPPIGAIMLIAGGIKVTAGSSAHKVERPIFTILMQMLILAARGESV